ncbi:protein FAM185A isoform X2 [Antennarius striatus]|uniref:protein FAM185A isoform X2 n=1 Tax=Antennarius striatus TaxID=241820 RepID=UPI0035ADA2C0
MFWRAAGQTGGVGLVRRWTSTVRNRTLTPLRCPSWTSRFFSISASSRCVPHEGLRPPLRQWALEVSPFSTVRAKIGCGISVRPLDPHQFPEADRAFIAVFGSGTERGVGQLHVHYNDQSQELLITGEEVHSSLSIHLSAPLKSRKADVQVKKMECDICEVQTDQGNCFLHSIKSHQVEVRSSGGHVTGAGTIHGNVNISTRGDGAVDVKKLQGTKMNVSTEHGLLKVKAIYAESSSISSSSGRVELGNVHGNASVKNMTGDTVIDGSNSFLEISSNSGSIDVYVGEGGSAKLHTQEGAVCVRVPSSLKAGVQLCGASVDISPEVVMHGVERSTTESQVTVTGHINGEAPQERWVKAQADRGSVKIRTQSWFESLKLGN